MKKVVLAEKFAEIREPWRPSEVGLFEPVGTRNTGNVQHAVLTAPPYEQL